MGFAIQNTVRAPSFASMWKPDGWVEKQGAVSILIDRAGWIKWILN
jgi:hypothetical protein